MSPVRAKRDEIARRYGYDLDTTVDAIRPTHRFDATCQGTVPTALVCTLESTSLENGLRNAVALGGDADTLAAIAGALGEALHGLPGVLVETVKTRYLQGAEDIMGALDALYPCASVVIDRDSPDVSAGSGATPRRRIMEVRNKRGE